MFVKQWLAASEAGVRKMHYHDFGKDQSHHVFPLVRKLSHLTVGQLWAFLLDFTKDLSTAAAFTGRVRQLAVGKIEVPFAEKQKKKKKKKKKKPAADAEADAGAVVAEDASEDASADAL